MRALRLYIHANPRDQLARRDVNQSFESRATHTRMCLYITYVCITIYSCRKKTAFDGNRESRTRPEKNDEKVPWRRGRKKLRESCRFQGDVTYVLEDREFRLFNAG